MANRAVVGVYSTEQEAAHAINELVNLGYSKDQISVLAQDPKRFEGLGEADDIKTESPKEVGKGAATGAVTGGVIGGIGALIAELGVLAIPGIGPFLAAGPIVATVGGLVAGGAIGGVVGALVGLGVDKEEAHIYEERLENGDILVIVQADNDRYDQTYATLQAGGSTERSRSGNAVVDQQNIVPGPYTDALQGNPEFNPNLDPDLDPNRGSDVHPELGQDRSIAAGGRHSDDIGEKDMKNMDNDRNRAEQRKNMNRDSGTDRVFGDRERTDLRRDADGDLRDQDRRPEHEEDDRSLGEKVKDRLDRDGDGRLDLDDLRINPEDTDNDPDSDRGRNQR